MERYEQTVGKIKTSDGKRRYETIYYPNFEFDSSDIYIISKQLDRMDNLAFQYYGDPRFWWIIQRVNNLPGGTFMIPAGLRIRIPSPNKFNEFTIQQLLNDKQF